MSDINSNSPLTGMLKDKDKTTVVEKGESYGIFTLGNRLFSYKNSSKRFILKVNMECEDVKELYNSTNTTDKEYLNYYFSNIIAPVFKKWVANQKQKEINKFLDIINNLKSDDEDTQVIIKDIYKYLLPNLLPIEQRLFVINK